jgi:acyl carrier protein
MDAPMKAARDAAKARIRRVFVESLELNVAEDSARDVRRLDELAGFDSGAAIVFVAGLEKEFAIEFEPEKLNLDFLSDVDQIAAYVGTRRGE